MRNLYIFLLGVFFVGLSSRVFANCNFDGSAFEQERKEAYFWSCNEGLIYEQYINDAKLNQELSRIEMARMLNIFAMKLMGKEEDPSRNCNGYSDLNYNDSIIANRACHLGIMGIGISKFKPNDTVSRAEFGTVLSRILYGDKYNVTEGKYYRLHLQALKDNGIITNDNPSIKEKKGYVLLMLKRYIDRIEYDSKNIEDAITLKNNNGYISVVGNNVTLSNFKNSITIDNKAAASDGKRSDSLQGPCAPGYHVPSKDEAEQLIDLWKEIREDDLSNENNIGDMFLKDLGVHVDLNKIFMKGEQKTQQTTFWTRSKASENFPYSLNALGPSVGVFCGIGCKLSIICFKTT